MKIIFALCLCLFIFGCNKTEQKTDTKDESKKDTNVTNEEKIKAQNSFDSLQSIREKLNQQRSDSLKGKTVAPAAAPTEKDIKEDVTKFLMKTLTVKEFTIADKKESDSNIIVQCVAKGPSYTNPKENLSFDVKVNYTKIGNQWHKDISYEKSK